MSPICKRLYVPLETPYVFRSKASLLKEMDSRLVKLTWTCETPRLIGNDTDKITNIRACNNCVPCIRQRTEKLMLEAAMLQEAKREKALTKLRNSTKNSTVAEIEPVR